MVHSPFPSWPDVAPDLISVAAGRSPAEMVIRGGTWVNVHSRETLPDHDIAITRGRIAFVGPDASYCTGPDTEVAYLTAVGDDAPSAKLTEFMRDSGVIPELKVRPGGNLGLYMVSLQNGERSFSYWRSTAAARTLADDLATKDAIMRGAAFMRRHLAEWAKQAAGQK